MSFFYIVTFKIEIPFLEISALYGIHCKKISILYITLKMPISSFLNQ